MGLRLIFAALLSTLYSVPLAAHELQPAIADLEVTDGEVVLTLDLNLEAYLSGIDLDLLDDTDEAEEAESYDTLRALSPDDLSTRVPELIADWSSQGMLRSGDTILALKLDQALIPPVGDVEILRPSRLILRAAFDGDALQVTWPAGAGQVVLRQQGVEDPFTGFLNGGETSPEIVFESGQSGGFWGFVCVIWPCAR